MARASSLLMAATASVVIAPSSNSLCTSELSSRSCRGGETSSPSLSPPPLSPPSLAATFPPYPSSSSSPSSSPSSSLLSLRSGEGAAVSRARRGTRQTVSALAMAAPRGFWMQTSRHVASCRRPAMSSSAGASVSDELTDDVEERAWEGEVVADDEEFYEVPVHNVRVYDRQRDLWFNVEVPEDQYILHTAEDQAIKLPFACRMGCCTACAVRVKSGKLYQPEALGISAELKEQGYALLCVGYPLSDLEVETQDEDEVYWLQFGRYFAKGPVGAG
ncbi:hypothetical protein CBR_g24310 [Chara braunii]|uniref:2Fe-2S ferredoxin-type domain-containing protein n=1 Tax=Chara braunii TaxID=69332 RepID=A0A388JMB1_CHABU|nr:hypothetical protein CBR_g24310 [Chara braunii]|eukprot:GBG58960.1 hypothetical protein CBR_g24310 [Chara braunii]